jgi:hypothetical protein
VSRDQTREEAIAELHDSRMRHRELEYQVEALESTNARLVAALAGALPYVEAALEYESSEQEARELATKIREALAAGGEKGGADVSHKSATAPPDPTGTPR